MGGTKWSIASKSQTKGIRPERNSSTHTSLSSNASSSFLPPPPRIPIRRNRRSNLPTVPASVASSASSSVESSAYSSDPSLANNTSPAVTSAPSKDLAPFLAKFKRRPRAYNDSENGEDPTPTRSNATTGVLGAGGVAGALFGTPQRAPTRTPPKKKKFGIETITTKPRKKYKSDSDSDSSSVDYNESYSLLTGMTEEEDGADESRRSRIRKPRKRPSIDDSAYNQLRAVPSIHPLGVSAVTMATKDTLDKANHPFGMSVQTMATKDTLATGKTHGLDKVNHSLASLSTVRTTTANKGGYIPLNTKSGYAPTVATGKTLNTRNDFGASGRTGTTDFGASGFTSTDPMDRANHPLASLATATVTTAARPHPPRRPGPPPPRPALLNQNSQMGTTATPADHAEGTTKNQPLVKKTLGHYKDQLVQQYQARLDQRKEQREGKAGENNKLATTTTRPPPPPPPPPRPTPRPDIAAMPPVIRSNVDGENDGNVPASTYYTARPAHYPPLDTTEKPSSSTPAARQSASSSSSSTDAASPPHANCHLYLILFLTSMICITALSTGTPADLRSHAERTALAFTGISTILSLVTFMALRHESTRGKLTRPIRLEVGQYGMLEFKSFACMVAVLFWILWISNAVIVIFVPNQELGVADQVEIWNANLYFGTWVSFGLTCYLYADGCVGANCTDEGDDEKRKQSSNPKVRVRTDIARAWILLLIFSVILVAFCVALLSGPICTTSKATSSLVLDEMSLCQRLGFGIVFGVVGTLLAAGYWAARMLRAYHNEYSITEARDKILWNTRVDWASSALSAASFTIFASNAVFLTSPLPTSSSGIGGVGGQPCNIYFASWACIGLSLYLVLRHVEMWSVQPWIQREMPIAAQPPTAATAGGAANVLPIHKVQQQPPLQEEVTDDEESSSSSSTDTSSYSFTRDDDEEVGITSSSSSSDTTSSGSRGPPTVSGSSEHNSGPPTLSDGEESESEPSDPRMPYYQPYKQYTQQPNLMPPLGAPVRRAPPPLMSSSINPQKKPDPDSRSVSGKVPPPRFQGNSRGSSRHKNPPDPSQKSRKNVSDLSASQRSSMRSLDPPSSRDGRSRQRPPVAHLEFPPPQPPHHRQQQPQLFPVATGSRHSRNDHSRASEHSFGHHSSSQPSSHNPSSHQSSSHRPPSIDPVSSRHSSSHHSTSHQSSSKESSSRQSSSFRPPSRQSSSRQSSSFRPPSKESSSRQSSSFRPPSQASSSTQSSNNRPPSRLSTSRLPSNQRRHRDQASHHSNRSTNRNEDKLNEESSQSITSSQRTSKQPPGYRSSSKQPLSKQPPSKQPPSKLPPSKLPPSTHSPSHRPPSRPSSSRPSSSHQPRRDQATHHSNLPTDSKDERQDEESFQSITSSQRTSEEPPGYRSSSKQPPSKLSPSTKAPIHRPPSRLSTSRLSSGHQHHRNKGSHHSNHSATRNEESFQSSTSSRQQEQTPTGGVQERGGSPELIPKRSSTSFSGTSNVDTTRTYADTFDSQWGAANRSPQTEDSGRRDSDDTIDIMLRNEEDMLRKEEDEMKRVVASSFHDNMRVKINFRRESLMSFPDDIKQARKELLREKALDGSNFDADTATRDQSSDVEGPARHAPLISSQSTTASPFEGSSIDSDTTGASSRKPRKIETPASQGRDNDLSPLPGTSDQSSSDASVAPWLEKIPAMPENLMDQQSESSSEDTEPKSQYWSDKLRESVHRGGSPGMPTVPSLHSASTEPQKSKSSPPDDAGRVRDEMVESVSSGVSTLDASHGPSTIASDATSHGPLTASAEELPPSLPRAARRMSVDASGVLYRDPSRSEIDVPIPGSRRDRRGTRKSPPEQPAPKTSFSPKFDIKDEGSMDRRGMKDKLIERAPRDMSEQEIDRVFKSLDKDGDGLIKVTEFEDWWIRNLNRPGQGKRTKKQEGKGRLKNKEEDKKDTATKPSSRQALEASKKRLPPETTTIIGSTGSEKSSTLSDLSDSPTTLVTKESASKESLSKDSTQSSPTYSSPNTRDPMQSSNSEQAISRSLSDSVTIASSRTIPNKQNLTVDQMVAAALKQAQDLKQTHDDAFQSSPETEVSNDSPKTQNSSDFKSSPVKSGSSPDSDEAIVTEISANPTSSSSENRISPSSGSNPTSSSENKSSPSSGSAEDGQTASLSSGDAIVDEMVLEALKYAQGAKENSGHSAATTGNIPSFIAGQARVKA